MSARTPESTAPPPAPSRLTSGAVCEAAGVTRGQLRLYEREGLLPPPRRTAGGFRDYPPDTLDRLQAIRQLKEIGFSLAEIALLLTESDHGHLVPERLQALALEQLRSIDVRIANLQVVRRFAEAIAAGDMTALGDPACGFLVQFLASGRSAGTREGSQRRVAEAMGTRV